MTTTTLILPAALIVALGLAGCAGNGQPEAETYANGIHGAGAKPLAPRTAGAVQTTETAAMGAPLPVSAIASPAEAAAAAGATAPGSLGTTVASLGAVGEGGLWLRTPLVKAKTAGRIVSRETGKSANVTLIPLSGGGGSQASLAALTAVGAGPTDLPTLEVFAG